MEEKRDRVPGSRIQDSSKESTSLYRFGSTDRSAFDGAIELFAVHLDIARTSGTVGYLHDLECRSTSDTLASSPSTVEKRRLYKGLC